MDNIQYTGIIITTDVFVIISQHSIITNWDLYWTAAIHVPSMTSLLYQILLKLFDISEFISENEECVPMCDSYFWLSP